MRSIRLVLALLVVGTASVAAAAAGDTTRAQFIHDADGICKAHAKRAAPYLKRGEALLDDRRYAAGARKMLRGVEILHGIRDVRRLPTPPGDAERIDAWLDGEIEALDLAARGWRAVKTEEFAQADRLFAKSRRVHRRAHQPVREFEFRECT